jgi:hypothetical protein
MVLQLIWVKTMMPETKGVPLEQMQKLLKLEEPVPDAPAAITR